MITCHPHQAQRIRMLTRNFRLWRGLQKAANLDCRWKAAYAYREVAENRKRQLLNYTSQFDLVPNDYQASLPLTK